MERHLAEALEQADDIIETVQREPPPARPSSTGEKSLQEKLYDIYVEECGKDPEVEGLQSNVNLLEKLLRREALPCLVVNLYPENQGYSLMLKDKDGILIEPFPVPYLGQKLLEYLDAEELPSFLIDVLEKSPVNVFHRGCVIAEIRDYRQCSDIQPPGYQTRHILLRPTMQTLVRDVESITSDNPQWTEEEKLELESQLILATAEPLCLDPSVAVACTANRLLFNEQKMMTDPMRQCFTSHEWSYLELEEEQYLCTTPPDVSTMAACRKQAEPKPGDQYDLKIAEAGECVDTWKQRPCELEAPGEVDVQKYASEKQAVPCDDAESTAWSPPEVKYDYPFECDEGSQLWEAQPSTSAAQPFSEPFLSPEVRPPTESRCDSQMYLPLVAPSDHSQGSVAGEGIEPGKVTSVGQGSIQSTAECLSKILQGSTDSIPLGQPSQGKKATSHSVVSPGLESRVNSPAALLTQPSTSGQGSSTVSSPSIRGRKLPRLAPSPRSGGSAQQTFWGVGGVRTPPSAARSSASSTETSATTQGPSSSGTDQNAINLLGLAQRGPVLMSSPSRVLSYPTGAPAPTETSSRGFLPPPRSQMLSAQGRAPQRSVQTSVKLIVKNTSGPVTVRLPPGSVILHPESQAQRQQPWPQPQQPQGRPWLQPQQPQARPWSQPQQLQPQPWLQPQQPQPRPWSQSQQLQQPQPRQYLRPELQRQRQSEPLYVLIPKQHQPPRAPAPSRAMPPAYPQRSSIQQWALSAQQSGLLNLAELGSARQPQATVVCQLGSTQQSHGHTLPAQSFQYPAARAEQLQAARAEQLQAARAEQLQAVRAEQLQAARAEQLQAARVEQLQAARVEQLQAARVEQLQAARVEQLQAARVEQLQAARVEQLQARGQNVQLRFMPRRVALPRAVLQHSLRGHPGGQYRGTGRGGPPPAPEP
ncbi:transcription factor SPT20 homolog [Apodemus sylvaticus]|uniref:transcription factor SPT20 homolog n=1 Tax=Apodemus sylvaticus TaxID=10129 RepID=UPI0022431E76|nr:transcription factor SPT20 homolog [Apodemus sylvaticus]